jgi:hypothetical protein
MSIVLASLLAVSAPHESPSQVVWKWRPGDTNCILRQDVGDARLFDIGMSPGIEELGFKIVDTRARTRESKPLKGIDVTFLPGGTAKLDGYLDSNKTPIGRNVWVFLGPDDPARLARASGVTVSQSEVGSMEIAIQSPGAAIDAVRSCADQRLKEWGVDAVALRALSVRPTPATPTEKWFSWSDYPDREKIYKNDIEVVARLDVAADGSVLKCTVVNRPPKEFIPAACNALMRNAKFNPARDAQGQAVAAPFLFRVNFAAYYI